MKNIFTGVIIVFLFVGCSKSNRDPVLGPLSVEHSSSNLAIWSSSSLRVKGLAFDAHVGAFTDGSRPTPAQLEAMVKSLTVSQDMKQKMEEEMFTEYNDWRSATADKAGNSDLPKVLKASDIWSVYSELLIYVDQDSSSVSYSFRLKADPDHEMIV